MKKVWLYVKLVAVVVLVFGAVAVYVILQKPTSKPPPLPGDDPEPPKPVEVPDFVTKLRTREKEIRDEIKSMSRDDLVDDINNRYG